MVTDSGDRWKDGNGDGGIGSLGGSGGGGGGGGGGSGCADRSSNRSSA